MKQVNLKYQGNMVIVGSGGISEELIDKVHYILENEFGFDGVEKYVNRDITNIKPFLDSEIKWNAPRSEVNRFNRNNHVFILQNSKVIDNRLEFLVEDLNNKVKELEIKDDHLNGYIELLSYLGNSDIINKIAPRFTNSRFNPASMEKQLAGIIKAAKMGGSNHVSLVMPKTIFEWSHHWLKKWHEDERFEIPAYDDFINHMVSSGMNSLVIFNPHAPKENLELSRKYNFNCVMIYPQTFTLSSNGWIYSISELFSDIGLNLNDYDPIKLKINNDKLELGKFKDISNLMMYSSAVDEGSRVNSQRAAKRFGLGYIESIKKREGEGNSTLVQSEELSKHLVKLKGYTSEANLKIYIFDDMVNSGGTSNNEAMLRKKQVEEFNKNNNTNYNIEVEVIASHLRFPNLKYLKHEFVDKIFIFDTVPYLPPLKEQVKRFGYAHKIEFLQGLEKQLALGIAMDYLVQNVHNSFERNHSMGPYREMTDKELVKRLGYGADMQNIFEKIEIEQDKLIKNFNNPSS